MKKILRFEGEIKVNNWPCTSLPVKTLPEKILINDLKPYNNSPSNSGRLFSPFW